MKVFVIGAGQVGFTIVEALHSEHELTVLDLDAGRLNAVGHRFDVVTVEGNGASRRNLQAAGVEQADLFIACTSRDESNIIAGDAGPEARPRREDDRPHDATSSTSRSGTSASWTSTS